MSRHQTPLNLGFDAPQLFGPVEGWKEQTYYVVDVALSKHNPIHRAILFVGFITNPERPLGGGYSCILNGKYEDPADASRIFYLKAICEIKEMRNE